MSLKGKVCTKGVWDESIPGIKFDENGVSNYASMFQVLLEMYPRGTEGENDWNKIISKAKIYGARKKYDCIVGVSGGTDSSYLLYLLKEIYGLRPLAVNLDNGWSSDIAVKNIKKVTSKLKIDLETYVINYQEIADLLRVYMRAGLPWIDIPTDIAIKSIMYRIAAKEGIKYVFRGNDFRSEGFQPREWTYGDGKQLLYLHKKYGGVPLKTFPNYTISNLIYYSSLLKIKSYFPYYYVKYDKKSAQEFLKEEYDWEYYGGHHYENIFTKFAMSYWLYEKYGIDKRKITLSAQIMSGQITRDDAIQLLQNKPFESDKIDDQINYVLKKLDIQKNEWKNIFSSPNRSFSEFPSYYPMMTRLTGILGGIIKLLYPYKPMSILQMEMRSEK